MTTRNIIATALSLGVAAMAGFVLVTTLYFGAKAVVETLRDGWRWLRAWLDARRRERDEALDEWARRVAR